MLHKLEGYIKSNDVDIPSINELLYKSASLYGAFGSEKMKVLEKSFDGFVENIMSGANLKLAFYIADKPMPTTFLALERFKKMKKFQKYEEYPDMHLREYLEWRANTITNREELYEHTKNKIVLVSKIKN